MMGFLSVIPAVFLFSSSGNPGDRFLEEKTKGYIINNQI